MRFVLAFVGSFALSAFVGSVPANADPLEGSWSGGGVVRHEGGTETIRCRISYAKSTGRTLTFNATCATTGGKVQQAGRVVALGRNRYTGRAYSKDYQVTGKLYVTVRGAKQSIRVTSPKGSANLTLRKR